MILVCMWLCVAYRTIQPCPPNHCMLLYRINIMLCLMWLCIDHRKQGVDVPSSITKYHYRVYIDVIFTVQHHIYYTVLDISIFSSGMLDG